MLQERANDAASLGSWALPPEQIALLSFEVLILSRPVLAVAGPTPTEPTPATAAAAAETSCAADTEHGNESSTVAEARAGSALLLGLSEMDETVLAARLSSCLVEQLGHEGSDNGDSDAAVLQAPARVVAAGAGDGTAADKWLGTIVAGDHEATGAYGSSQAMALAERGRHTATASGVNGVAGAEESAHGSLELWLQERVEQVGSVVGEAAEAVEEVWLRARKTAEEAVAGRTGGVSTLVTTGMAEAAAAARHSRRVGRRDHGEAGVSRRLAGIDDMLLEQVGNRFSSLTPRPGPCPAQMPDLCARYARLHTPGLARRRTKFTRVQRNTCSRAHIRSVCKWPCAAGAAATRCSAINRRAPFPPATTPPAARHFAERRAAGLAGATRTISTPITTHGGRVCQARWRACRFELHLILPHSHRRRLATTFCPWMKLLFRISLTCHMPVPSPTRYPQVNYSQIC